MSDLSTKQTEGTDEKQNKPWLFKKGESGNPNGRPKGSISITEEVKRKLKELPEGQQKTYLQLFIERLLHNAIVAGDQRALKDIWNYIDGMPRQRIGIEGGEEGSRLDVRIVKYDDSGTIPPPPISDTDTPSV